MSEIGQSKVEQQLDLYVRAIQRLDAQKAAGELDPVRWEVLRAKMLRVRVVDIAFGKHGRVINQPVSSPASSAR